MKTVPLFTSGGATRLQPLVNSCRRLDGTEARLSGTQSGGKPHRDVHHGFRRLRRSVSMKTVPLFTSGREERLHPLVNSSRRRLDGTVVMLSGTSRGGKPHREARHGFQKLRRRVSMKTVL